MTKFSAKTSLLSLAVLVALSGCGKSKELNTPAAPNAPAAPAAPSESAPPVPTPDLNKSLPDVNNNPDNELLPDDGKRVPPSIGGETKDTDTDKSAGSNAGESTDPGDIDFSTITAAKTGGTSKDMYYTGAGSDGLMEEWYESGLPYTRFEYVHGQEEGAQRMWTEYGVLRANYVVTGGRRYGLMGTTGCQSTPHVPEVSSQ